MIIAQIVNVPPSHRLVIDVPHEVPAGAVAGGIASEEVKTFAVKSGFFVLEQTGDTVKISVPENFKPKEW
jgi:hypothetical protein